MARVLLITGVGSEIIVSDNYEEEAARLREQGHDVRIISYAHPLSLYFAIEYLGSGEKVIGHSAGSLVVHQANTVMPGNQGLEVGLFGRNSNDYLLVNHAIENYTPQIDDYVNS